MDQYKYLNQNSNHRAIEQQMNAQSENGYLNNAPYYIQDIMMRLGDIEGDICQILIMLEEVKEVK